MQNGRLNGTVLQLVVYSFAHNGMAANGQINERRPANGVLLRIRVKDDSPLSLDIQALIKFLQLTGV